MCGASHEVHHDVRSEFFLIADFASIREVGSKRAIAAYLKATPSSTFPATGSADVISLEVSQLDSVGGKTIFSLRATDVKLGTSSLSFDMVAGTLPSDGRFIPMNNLQVDKWSFIAKCKRRPDLDSL